MLQHYDQRNDDLKIYVNGHLLPRSEARISVFDSVVQGGDAVWEGLRLYNKSIYALEEHLTRLVESAKALDFKQIPGKEEVTAAIKETLHANQMTDGVHIRLTLTRGEKYTSGMDPRLNKKGCSLVVLAEWKPPVYDKAGISLITSSVRRNNPNHLDSKIHHNNLLNNILAKTEANVAGADDALMLDVHGFVAETNATNFFIIKDDHLYTPHADSCLPGITRQTVLDICSEQKVACHEQNLSLAQCYNADIAFVSGTMGELVRVNKIDGRNINNSTDNKVFDAIKQAYHYRTIHRSTEIL